MNIILITLQFGLILCVLVHFSSFSDFAHSLFPWIHAFNFGLGILFFTLIGISKKIFKGTEKTVPRERMKNACPEKMYVVMGCFIFYGAIMFCFSLFRIMTSDSHDANLNTIRLVRGLSALLIVLYSIGYPVLYGFNAILKSDKKYHIDNYYDDGNDNNI